MRLSPSSRMQWHCSTACPLFRRTAGPCQSAYANLQTQFLKPIKKGNAKSASHHCRPGEEHCDTDGNRSPAVQPYLFFIIVRAKSHPLGSNAVNTGTNCQQTQRSGSAPQPLLAYAHLSDIGIAFWKRLTMVVGASQQLEGGRHAHRSPVRSARSKSSLLLAAVRRGSRAFSSVPVIAGCLSHQLRFTGVSPLASDESMVTTLPLVCRVFFL